MQNLEILEEAYCKAANDLSEYRHKNGFEPGTKVITRYQDKAEKHGIIAPHGDAWFGINHMSVPVLLDDGKLQSWDMSNLTIVKN